MVSSIPALIPHLRKYILRTKELKEFWKKEAETQKYLQGEQVRRVRTLRIITSDSLGSISNSLESIGSRQNLVLAMCSRWRSDYCILHFVFPSSSDTFLYIIYHHVIRTSRYVVRFNLKSLNNLIEIQFQANATCMLFIGITRCYLNVCIFDGKPQVSRQKCRRLDNIECNVV